MTWKISKILNKNFDNSISSTYQQLENIWKVPSGGRAEIENVTGWANFYVFEFESGFEISASDNTSTNFNFSTSTTNVSNLNLNIRCTHEVCMQTYSWGASASWPYTCVSVCVNVCWKELVNRKYCEITEQGCLFMNVKCRFCNFTQKLLKSKFIIIVNEHRASMVATCIVIMWQNALSLNVSSR